MWWWWGGFACFDEPESYACSGLGTWQGIDIKTKDRMLLLTKHERMNSQDVDVIRFIILFGGMAVMFLVLGWVKVKI